MLQIYNRNPGGFMKIIQVDQTKCIGCGLCISSCGEVFEFDENGKARVKDASACEGNPGCCQQALDNCPAKAISWTDN